MPLLERMAVWKSVEQCEPGLIVACLRGTFGLMMLTVREHVPAAPFRKGIHTLVLVMQEDQVRKAVVEPRRLQINCESQAESGSERESKRERERERPSIHIHKLLFFLAHL